MCCPADSGGHGGHGDDDGDDDGRGECHVSCPNHGDDKDHGTGNGGACDTLGIRACFSTQALLGLFAGAKLPCDLLDAEMHATLTNGGTVVATFSGTKHKDKDKDCKGERGHAGVLSVNVKPNPLNPRTELSFTMSRGGRVRVTVYDTRGRLVKALLDEVRAAGDQKLAWDGSNAQSQKVASGVYFFRIQAPEGEVVQRVAVVK